MVAGPGELVTAVRVDVKRLHESWMELFFPRQRGADQTVLGKWKPSTTGGKLRYRAWAVAGMLMVALLYPLAVVGFAARFYSRRLDSAATRLGIVGVVLLTAFAWGILTLGAYLRDFSEQGVLAVAAASIVAIISSALSVVFARIDGRPVTVLLAYPFAVTAITLPPVVAAFYSPTLASVVFPGSETLAAWILDNVLFVGGLNRWIRQQFELTGGATVAMWFGFSMPVGWILGIMVTLANVIRPSGE